MLMAAAPNPMWFASRGTGVAALLLLTASTVVGILSGGKAKSQAWPRFVSAGWHRNLSLFASAFLVIHVLLAILDPFAGIRWLDAVVPLAGSYRPVWLGLGVISMELVAALLITSAVRRQIGYKTWRAIHWAGYASWPLALVHSLGTGSDIKAPWMLGLSAACLVAVVLASAWRLDVAPSLTMSRRLAGTAGVFGLTIVIAAWTLSGPLAPHWALRSGTPAAVLARGAAAQAYVAPAAAAGPMTARSIRAEVVSLPGGGTRIAMTDVENPSLQYVLRSARPGESSAVLAVLSGGHLGCVAPADVKPDVVTATCGHSRIYLKLGNGPNGAGGTMWFEPVP